MHLVKAKHRLLLLRNSGEIHAPFTLYLNEGFDNPHTQDSVARSLRMLDKFLQAMGIGLCQRALRGECLLDSEKSALVQLAYRSIQEIESMSDRMIKRVATTTGDVQPGDRDDAVQHNTAARRLDQIADFLEWYYKRVLRVRMSVGSTSLAKLEASYAECCDALKGRIGRTKTGHTDKLRSLPLDRYLAIYRKVFLEPESVFLAPSSETSSTVLRDRAVVLLGLEGLRPGAIGNIQLADFRWSGELGRDGLLRFADNVAKRGSPVTTDTPTQKGIRSNQGYHSAYDMTLWPTTCAAIEAYKRTERHTIVSKTLTNQSKGFLFVAEHGGPIANRATISAVFRRAREGLRAAGLLKVAKDDLHAFGQEYDFTCYVLRHSAATAYYKWNRDKPDVEALMKKRFGWSDASNMPGLYADRAIREAAALTVNEWVDGLFQDQKRLGDES
jgi:integrase